MLTAEPAVAGLHPLTHVSTKLSYDQVTYSEIQIDCSLYSHQYQDTWRLLLVEMAAGCTYLIYASIWLAFLSRRQSR